MSLASVPDPWRFHTDPDLRIRTSGLRIDYGSERLKNLRVRPAISLSLGLHKGRPSYKRSLQLSKENIQHFEIWYLLIFLLLWVVFALMDPDPDSEYGSGSTDPIESIQFGSGSATMPESIQKPE